MACGPLILLFSWLFAHSFVRFFCFAIEETYPFRNASLIHLIVYIMDKPFMYHQNDFDGVVNEIATRSFGLELRPEQRAAFFHLVAMSNRKSGLYPSSYLLIQKTGGGKSLVRNMVGRALRGVTWTLSPLLSLSSDQVTSTQRYIDNSTDDRFMKSYNLDTYHSDSDIRDLKNDLLSITAETSKFFSLYCSPGRLHRNKWMIDLFHELLERGTLRLFCVDEIHEAINQAIFFRRSDYSTLHEISKALIPNRNEHCKENELRVPVLCMTATASWDMIENHYPLLMGHSILQHNIRWPPPQKMRRRNVFFNVHFKVQHLHYFKSEAEQRLKEASDTKLILYHNFRTRLDIMANDLRDWMDEDEGLSMVDLVPVNGALSADEKFQRILIFTGKETTDSLNPRLGCFTDAANAGIDCDLVYFVFRCGFCDNLFKLLQEWGRAARKERIGSDPRKKDTYFVCCQLPDYVSLMSRVFQVENGPANNGMLPATRRKNLALQNLNEVVRELTLPVCCYHLRFEWLFSNEGRERSTTSEKWNQFLQQNQPCGTNCSYCTNQLNIRKINIPEARKLITDAFVSHAAITKSLPDEFCKTLVRMPNASKRIFQHVRSSNEPKLSDVKFFVLQLLGAGILDPHYDTNTGSVTVTLAKNSGSQ